MSISKQLPMFDAIEIPLTYGYTATVDPIDADLAQCEWRILANRERKLYACRGKGTYMHRVILQRVIGRPLEKGEYADHIDGNPLNNSRSNLRVSTASQNSYNAKTHCTNTSGYKGVTWSAARNKWVAQIKHNYAHIHLGAFDTPEEAHEAYKTAALKYAGEFARLK